MQSHKEEDRVEKTSLLTSVHLRILLLCFSVKGVQHGLRFLLHAGRGGGGRKRKKKKKEKEKTIQRNTSLTYQPKSCIYDKSFSFLFVHSPL